jgi:hypothetical protein
MKERLLIREIKDFLKLFFRVAILFCKYVAYHSATAKGDKNTSADPGPGYKVIRNSIGICLLYWKGNGHPKAMSVFFSQLGLEKIE